jgi:quercetin dioxygenase-like cupin family protein
MDDERAIQTILIDNDEVRVTEWRFAPGTSTGHHRHEYGYVVVPQTTGPLSIHADGGTTSADLVMGLPYYRQAGVEHEVQNANDYEFVFVEIEVKRTPVAAQDTDDTT